MCNLIGKLNKKGGEDKIFGSHSVKSLRTKILR